MEEDDEKEKWRYVKLISMASNKFGDKLLDMMNQYNKNNLADINKNEVIQYWRKINNKI